MIFHASEQHSCQAVAGVLGSYFKGAPCQVVPPLMEQGRGLSRADLHVVCCQVAALLLCCAGVCRRLQPAQPGRRRVHPPVPALSPLAVLTALWHAACAGAGRYAGQQHRAGCRTSSGLGVGLGHEH